MNVRSYDDISILHILFNHCSLIITKCQYMEFNEEKKAKIKNTPCIKKVDPDGSTEGKKYLM